MAILLNNHGYDNHAWRLELQKQLQSMAVYVYPHIPEPKEIKYALVWNHPQGDLKNYQNLKAILSLAAGVEHITDDPTLPDVPIVRLVDPAVAQDMAMHALYWVINFHRHYYLYTRQQQQLRWQRHDRTPMSDFRVGVLGLGNIGSQVAQKIAANGYPVSGWSLSGKKQQKVTLYQGDNQLEAFLKPCCVVINCLPLTRDTTGLINAAFFARMRKKSFLVNISRGNIMHETDLLAALDSGHLAAAALDVFTQEPLCSNSPLWLHPKTHITPHMSGATYAQSAVKVLVNTIQILEKGDQAWPLYDRNKGY